MKKKLLIRLATSLIAMFFITDATDVGSIVSLSDIEIMAQASSEGSDFCNCDHSTTGMCWCHGYQPYQERYWW